MKEKSTKNLLNRSAYLNSSTSVSEEENLESQLEGKFYSLHFLSDKNRALEPIEYLNDLEDDEPDEEFYESNLSSGFDSSSFSKDNIEKVTGKRLSKFQKV